jgi:hypothetical protein
MWPHVAQFETRRLQMQRELQLTREIRAARRLEAGPSPARPKRLRPPTLSWRIDRRLSAARSRSW